MSLASILLVLLDTAICFFQETRDILLRSVDHLLDTWHAKENQWISTGLLFFLGLYIDFVISEAFLYGFQTKSNGKCLSFRRGIFQEQKHVIDTDLVFLYIGNRKRTLQEKDQFRNIYHFNDPKTCCHQHPTSTFTTSTFTATPTWD